MSDFASLEEALAELESVQFDVLFQNLVRYAQNRIKGNNIVDAEKIVEDVLEKVVTGDRNWNKRITFRRFLFRSVKSLVHSYNKQHGFKYLDVDSNIDVEVIEANKETDQDKTEYLIELIIEELKKHKYPIDENEEMVLRSMLDEMDKPREIAEFWGIDVQKVYRANEKLDKKLPLIREIINNHSYEQ